MRRASGAVFLLREKIKKIASELLEVSPDDLDLRDGAVEVRGVPGMRVGGKRLLVIPPALGYGSQRRGMITADAVLVFELTVVSAK